MRVALGLHTFLVLFLQTHLAHSAQICAPNTRYYRVSNDQSSGASWNPTVQTGVARALLDECKKNGDYIKKGFTATATGWFGSFSGCDAPNVKCEDIAGRSERSGMQGGDIMNMVKSCIDKSASWSEGQPYLLTVSPDGNFYGGAFEHNSGDADHYTACGSLLVAAGNGQFFGGGV